MDAGIDQTAISKLKKAIHGNFELPQVYKTPKNFVKVPQIKGFPMIS